MEEMSREKEEQERQKEQQKAYEQYVKAVTPTHSLWSQMLRSEEHTSELQSQR